MKSLFPFRPDETPRPDVRGKCKRCNPHSDDVRQNRVIVSSAGTAHLGDGYRGETKCGIEATGDAWWWPL